MMVEKKYHDARFAPNHKKVVAQTNDPNPTHIPEGCRRQCVIETNNIYAIKCFVKFIQ